MWGVFALFFESPTAIGLSISSLSLAGASLFTLELMYRSYSRHDQFAACVDYLEEGSVLYLNTLIQCKWIATKKQLLSEAAIFFNTSTKSTTAVRNRIIERGGGGRINL